MADQALNDIKERLEIVDVIGSYIPLKKSGTNYKATCPFHNEKSASFMVSPQKEIWHCFGCGEGGDIFGFVMRYENIQFREALQLLAVRAGVELPQYNRTGSNTDDTETLIRINNFAARYYHQKLLTTTGKPALNYLHERGLTDGTVAAWEIGFAPDDFHSLEEALKQKGATLDQMVKAGVSVKNERGQMYDRFRNRITFPIRNYYGEVIGFSARILEITGGSSGVQQAKYVNSPETSVYNKSKILFGLHAAKEAIRKADEAVIVEGQMDCIQAHQAGFTNTVASSGTALTDQQLRQLGRLTKNLKFCFDADSAGSAATRRAGELALQLGFRLKIIVLKEVKDPDELIRKSPGLWAKAVQEAVWFLDYYINRALEQYPSGSIEQKHYVSEQVLPLLGFITDPVEQDHYIHKLGTEFMISEKVIHGGLKRPALGMSMPTPATTEINPSIKAQIALEKQVLGGLLAIKEFVDFAREEGLGEEFSHPTLRQLAENVLTGAREENVVNGDVLAKEAMFMVESQLDNLENNELALMRELKKSLFLLKLAHIKRRQQELTLEIKKLEKQNDSIGVERLTRAFAELAQVRARIETQLS